MSTCAVPFLQSNVLVKRPPEEIRAAIMRFEKVIEKLSGAFFSENNVCPLKHSFANGVYVREIFMPKGLIIVGKIHKYAHPNFLMQGEVLVVTEHDDVQHLIAPFSMISQAGTKRVVFTLQDTVWITIHVTDKTDKTSTIAEIESDIVVQNYNELSMKK